MLLFPIFTFSQLIENRIEQIDLKLDYDKHYLNAKFINFTGSEIPELKNLVIPRVKKKPFKFKNVNGYSYRILFLDEGIGLDSTFLLRVEELHQAQGVDSNVVGDLDLFKIDTTVVLYFRDLNELKHTDFLSYSKIIDGIENFILNRGNDAVGKTLKINLDNRNLTVLGMARRDNSDFLEFERPLENHFYPKKIGRIKSSFSRRAVSTESDFRARVGLSAMSFSYKPLMDFGDNSGASIEINTEDANMNLLPYYANTINALARIIIGSKKNDINNSFYVIAKVGYRFTYNNEKIIKVINNINIEKPKINFTNAFLFEVNLTKPFYLPFFTLRGSLGQKDINRIKFYVPSNEFGKYYYSRDQVQGFFSFYWNASDNLINRFRIDVGVGYHDIIEPDKITQTPIYWLFQPMIGFNYIYYYSGNPLIGFSTRLYDQVFKSKIWVNIVHIGNNDFRVSLKHHSDPVFRQIRPWEVKNGVFIDLSWRYGLN